jgi:hypothetical protein
VDEIIEKLTQLFPNLTEKLTQFVQNLIEKLTQFVQNLTENIDYWKKHLYIEEPKYVLDYPTDLTAFYRYPSDEFWQVANVRDPSY